MRFLPPLILHGAHSAPESAVAAHVEVFKERLQSYPNWPEMDELEQCPACEVPQSHRPEV
jgi:glutathione-regulated potassium-efflux system ancillary protein KefF